MYPKFYVISGTLHDKNLIWQGLRSPVNNVYELLIVEYTANDVIVVPVWIFIAQIVNILKIIFATHSSAF